jgi:general secretion pathway protein M
MIGRWHDAPWLRRAAFLGLNLAAGVAIFVMVIHPIDVLFAEREAQIAMSSETLARMKAVASRRSDVDALARQVDAESDLGEFLAVANEGAANAGLQARLKTMAETSGARIRSVQGLPSKTNGQISYIGARVDLYGPLAAVHKAIYAIESAKPYLFVSTASIRLSPPVGAPATTAEPVIGAQLDVYGAVRMESPVR